MAWNRPMDKLDKYAFQIRVTGILLRDNEILLVKQKVSESRNWSLPGGRVETGETLEQALIRELKEETGLTVQVGRLLYVCDKPDASPPILHITFSLHHTGGQIALPTNEFDQNPISDVRFVPISDLAQYGFSETFMGILRHGFPNAGGYMGLKSSIGL